MSSVKSYIDQLIELDEQAKIPNASLDVILQCIQTPIHWLAKLDAQQQLALIFHKSWKQHVWHVYHDMVPLWSFSLATTHKDLLLHTLFVPSASDQVRISMARTSFPVLIECLSFSDVDFGTLELYANALEMLCFSPRVVPYYALYIPTLDVRFFCSLVCSVPTHLANAFGIQLQEVRFNKDHTWYIESNFYAKTSQCLAENLNPNSIYYTQELLGKMIRQGHEDIVMESIYHYARKSPSLWPQVFEQVETIASPEQVVQSMLCYARQKETKPISSIARDIASILLKGASEERLERFLNIGLLKLSKSSWADGRLTRMIVSAVVCTQPMQEKDPVVYPILMKFTKKLIQYWSDPVFIQFASSRERLYLTTSIISLLAYLDDRDIKTDIMMSTSLIKSVSSYFDSGDSYTAQLGAVMAESISSRVDKEKPLDTGLVCTESLLELKQLIFIRDAFNQKEDTESSSESEFDVHEKEDELLDPDAEFDTNDEDSESDLEPYYMEDESEDEGMKRESSQKKQQKKPVFIRDLIGCLRDQNDPLKLELGLKEAEQVIRRKTGAGTELAESSILLAKYLITFPESYEIDHCQELQQKALIALLVGVPETVAGFIIDQLYDRNTSIGQKQIILGSISLAVRELAGWSDNDQQDIPKVKELESTPIGQSLFKSTRMEVASRQKTAKNKLSGLAGHVFFFPMLVGWWEGAQGRIKYWIGNNTLLTERFIMALNIILHSSTNTPDKRRIVQEYFEFSLSMRYFKNTSTGIQRALLLGIDTILNISYKGQEQLLLHDYFKELSQIKEWIEDTMENQPEASIQEIMVRILIRLSQLATSG